MFPIQKILFEDVFKHDKPAVGGKDLYDGLENRPYK